MNRALLIRNLRQQRWLILSMIAGMMTLEVLIVQIAAAFENSSGIAGLFEMLPPAFQSLMGAQFQELSLTSLIAFGFQHPAALVMGLALVLVIATLPAAERESGLLDLFLARAVTRQHYLTANVLSIVVISVALPLAQLVGAALSLAFVSIDDKPSWTLYLPGAATETALLLAFGGLTLVFAASAARRGVAVSRAAGVILTAYVIEALAVLWEPLNAINWVSPFHYFQPVSAALSGASALDALVLAAIFAACTVLAFRRFARHDI